MEKIKPVILIILFLNGITLYAQESVTAAGGNAAGSSGSVSYSVGLVLYTTTIEAEGSVAQGLQHAYEIYSLDVDQLAMNISLSVFPNPTSDFITLRILDNNFEKLSYQLFDLTGNLIESRNIQSDQSLIDMSRLSSAVYFMHILKGNERIQSFKVIKK
jgi:hypothetical protein